MCIKLQYFNDAATELKGNGKKSDLQFYSQEQIEAEEQRITFRLLGTVYFTKQAVTNSHYTIPCIV